MSGDESCDVRCTSASEPVLSSPEIVRKFQRQGHLVAAARAFLEYVRERELRAAIVIPLEEQHRDYVALGSARKRSGS